MVKGKTHEETRVTKSGSQVVYPAALPHFRHGRSNDSAVNWQFGTSRGFQFRSVVDVFFVDVLGQE